MVKSRDIPEGLKCLALYEFTGESSSDREEKRASVEQGRRALPRCKENYGSIHLMLQFFASLLCVADHPRCFDASHATICLNNTEGIKLQVSSELCCLRKDDSISCSQPWGDSVCLLTSVCPQGCVWPSVWGTNQSLSSNLWAKYSARGASVPRTKTGGGGGPALDPRQRR